MPSNALLLETAEELKRLLLGHVESTPGNPARYTALRSALLRERRLAQVMPEFLRRDSDLQEVRNRSQRLDGNNGNPVTPYRVRRAWIAEQFQPLFDLLQRPEMSSVEEVLAECLGTVDSDHVRRTWEKAIERRQTDLDGAVTLARTLVETVCKHVLGAGYTDSPDLLVLYKHAAKTLGLTEEQATDDALKKMMRGCVNVIDGLATVRNRLSDAHGRGPGDSRPDQAQAEFAVTVAGAMATYLISAWERKRE